jgi:hypothetical protein
VSNHHTDSKKFAPGQSTGVYRGRMKHGAGVEHFKDALHTVPSRNPGGAATLAEVSAKGATTFGESPNAAANAKFNGSRGGPRETTDPARLIGAGVIKGN